jgi:hypothetical protein
MKPEGCLLLASLALLLVSACGSTNSSRFSDGGGGGSGGGGDATLLLDGGSINLASDANGVEASGATVGPTTCAEAASSKSYIGCDYWPTVTVNDVWSIFDYTVVVANTEAITANVTVTGYGAFSTTATVAPNSLTKIYLPWVPALKGPDADNCGDSPLFNSSIMAPASAYHLVSSVPVTVYQFNALEYQGMGGPPGKDWSACPGDTACSDRASANFGGLAGCFSFSNDASLLLPSTAMTGNYRVATEHGWTLATQGAYFVVTATEDATDVTVTLSATASVVAGNGIAATGPGGTLSLVLNAGDVVEIMSAAVDTADLSGSLVQANKPIQVLAGMQCTDEPLYPGDPNPAPACDHLESSVLPAETLGNDYVVTVPTSPGGTVIGAKVRFVGNVDGTALTYSPSQPPGCPTTLAAGQVVECTGTPSCPYTTYDLDARGNPVAVLETANCVTQSFEVSGNHEFEVITLMLGGSIVDAAAAPGMQLGDPSMSPMVTTQQYRTRYIFLAPTDYSESYADVVATAGDTLTLDGAALAATATPLNASWSIYRVPLGAGNDGAHTLVGTKPFGVQVIGYGNYTSYQYPAGLDLAQISPPPPSPPIK